MVCKNMVSNTAKRAMVIKMDMEYNGTKVMVMVSNLLSTVLFPCFSESSPDHCILKQRSRCYRNCPDWVAIESARANAELGHNQTVVWPALKRKYDQ